MDRNLLIDTGRALYGDNWKTSLARELGVTVRTMRRWVAGDTSLPPDLASRLVAIVRRHIHSLEVVHFLLRGYGK